MTEVPESEPERGVIPLGTIQEAYYEATGTTSNIARQLSFAGIALIWVLSGGSLTPDGRLSIADDLLWAGLILVIALTCDLLQYIYRSAAWGIFSRIVEKSGRDAAAPSVWINRPAIGLLVLKVTAVGSAYVLLIVAIASRLG